MDEGKLKKQKLISEEGRITQEDSIASGNVPCEEEIEMPEKEMSFEHQNEPQVLQSYEVCLLDDTNSDIESPSLPSSDIEIGKSVVITPKTSNAGSKEEKPCAFQSASFKLFIDYGSRLKRIHGKPITLPRYETECAKVVDQKLSTNAIILLAGEKFIQFLETSSEDLSMNCLLFSEEFSSLNKEDARDVELVFYLLACADNVNQKQFDHARKLLEHCDELSSCVGDPVQRLVYHFSKALNEKIDRETMKTPPSNLGIKQLQDVEEGMMTTNPTVLAFNKVFPATYIIHLAGIQAIVELTSEAKKIHIIDLSIKAGQHHSMLIQALADESECHLEHLKVTAVGTASKSKIEETGNRLISFARSLSLSFSFNVVMVDDILNLDEGLLSVDSDEIVVVYSTYFLRSLLGQPDRLESLMRVIWSIKPSLMVVGEVESNHNSPVFVNRFIEALFFFGAQFDSLEDCMKNDESNRSILESFYFSTGISNILATEGPQRAFREVKIEVWRAFFNRFGMLETPLSISSLAQAKAVIKNYSSGSSCTLDMDGECLIIGWKETPLYSLSAWTFK
ncbi:hypothetical protein Leryth_022974 [Lithospermum erythrorhizon]|nr:hypothetical protein Leryth_022974 [Lithospermum erythrorhizon]